MVQVINRKSLADRIAYAWSEMFTPYQLAWMRDASPVKWAEKSRRIGWTYCDAAEVVLTRVTGQRPWDAWVSSADLDAAKLYIDDVAEWMENLRQPIKTATEIDIFEGREVKSFVATIPVGGGKTANITALSSNPSRMRSKGGDVRLDELAFHIHADEMLKAATPVASHGYQLAGFSSHNGKRSTFNQRVEAAKRVAAGEGRPGDLAGSVHRTTFLDAVDQGLVELLNRAQGRNLTREAFIETNRSRVTPEDWNEEYLCIPRDHAGSFFGRGITGPAAYKLDAHPTPKIGQFLKDILTLSDEATALYAGIDIGRKNDPCTFFVSAKFGPKYRTVGILRLQRADFAQIGAALTALMDLRLPGGLRVNVAAIDATGLGMQTAEEAKKAYPNRVLEVEFTLPFKQAAYPTARTWLSDGSHTLPDSEELREDFAKVKADHTPKGRMTFIAERDEEGHADIASAFVLAIHAAEAKVSAARTVTLARGTWA